MIYQIFLVKVKADCSIYLLMTNVPDHIETSQLICNANQLTCF